MLGTYRLPYERQRRVSRTASHPPICASAGTHSPVMNDASSETRNATSLATSSGCPFRPNAHWNCSRLRMVSSHPTSPLFEKLKHLHPSYKHPSAAPSPRRTTRPCPPLTHGRACVYESPTFDVQRRLGHTHAYARSHSRRGVSVIPGAYAFTVVPYFP